MSVENWNKRTSVEVATSEKSLKVDGWFLHRLGDGEKMLLGLPPVCVLGRKICHSKIISVQHVSICIRDSEELYLRDLESRYGTFVNDKRISSDGIVLKEFDIIGLGCRRPRTSKDFCFLLRIKDSTESELDVPDCVESSVASRPDVFQEFKTLQDSLPDISKHPESKSPENDLTVGNRSKYDPKLSKSVVHLKRLRLIERMVSQGLFVLLIEESFSSDISDTKTLPNEKEFWEVESVTLSNCDSSNRNTGSIQSKTPSGNTVANSRCTDSDLKETNLNTQKNTAKKIQDVRSKVESWLSENTSNSDSSFEFKSFKRIRKDGKNNDIIQSSEKEENIKTFYKKAETDSKTTQLKNKRKCISSYIYNTESDNSTKSSEDKVSEYTLSQESSDEKQEKKFKQLRTRKERPFNSGDYRESDSSLSDFIVPESSDDEDKSNRRLLSKLAKRDRYYRDNPWTPRNPDIPPINVVEKLRKRTHKMPRY